MNGILPRFYYTPATHQHLAFCPSTLPTPANMSHEEKVLAARYSETYKIGYNDPICGLQLPIWGEAVHRLMAEGADLRVEKLDEGSYEFESFCSMAFHGLRMIESGGTLEDVAFAIALGWKLIYRAWQDDETWMSAGYRLEPAEIIQSDARDRRSSAPYTEVPIVKYLYPAIAKSLVDLVNVKPTHMLALQTQPSYSGEKYFGLTLTEWADEMLEVQAGMFRVPIELFIKPELGEFEYDIVCGEVMAMVGAAEDDGADLEDIETFAWAAFEGWCNTYKFWSDRLPWTDAANGYRNGTDTVRDPTLDEWMADGNALPAAQIALYGAKAECFVELVHGFRNA